MVVSEVIATLTTIDDRGTRIQRKSSAVGHFAKETALGRAEELRLLMMSKHAADITFKKKSQYAKSELEDLWDVMPPVYLHDLAASVYNGILQKNSFFYRVA